MDVNWPTAALLFGLSAILVFRAPLSRLLERTEKIKDWLIAPKQPALPSSDNALPTRAAADDQKALEELTQGFDNQLLLLQEESIREDLTKHGFRADGACEKVLLRHLAATQIALHFEKINAALYRSQLDALRWLNSQQIGVQAERLQPFYHAAAKAWPAMYAAIDFRSWLGFLASQGLITESEQSAASSTEAEPFGIEISVLGRQYLAYLVNVGRADPPFG